jgi:hypothetical protein
VADQTDGLDGLELIPADDVIGADDALAAAAASALEDPVPQADEDVQEPFGRTWLFDFERGRFVRDGIAPRVTTGRQSLAVWANMAMRTARGQHPVFSPEFGHDDPDAVIGEAANVDDRAGDWLAATADALLVHDRIASVENVSAYFDQTEWAYVVETMDVYTDEEADEDPLRLGGQTVGTVA